MFAATLTACSEDDEIESNWTIDEARRFDEFPLYWLGDSYMGLPLTAVTHGQTVDLETVGFVYGESSCNDSACNAPIWIITEPYCQSSPEQVRSLLNEFKGYGSVISEVEFREAKGYLTDWEEPRLYFWTGGSAIQINSNDSTVSIHQVAQDLIPVTNSTDAKLKPLPPPITKDC